jgi:hypothetical protein
LRFRVRVIAAGVAAHAAVILRLGGVYHDPPERRIVPLQSQKQCEAVHGVIDRIAQQFERWNDRFTLENPRFIEKYKQGELQILLHFSAGVIDKDYVALLQGCPILGDGNYVRARFREFWENVRVQARYMNTEISASNGEREPVPIDDAQTVQTPEGLAIPSLIWFDCSDRIYSILPKSLYFSKRFGFVFRGVIGNREINFAVSAVSPLPESAGHPIKSRTEALDSIPSNSGDHRIDWLRIRDLIRRSSLRVKVANELVWTALPKVVDCGFQIHDMLVGPFDFDAN